MARIQAEPFSERGASGRQVHGAKAEAASSDQPTPILYPLRTKKRARRKAGQERGGTRLRGGKVGLTAGVTKDFTDRVKAGDLMREFAGRLGGKGGGKPDMAQGGGADVQALPEVLKSVPEWVSSQLG